ncbi:MAG: hypothetical protein LBH32_08875 [Dysgonamonadaceae bacterium]|jgi:hypothetical protein|nr:hypothetical protein [Dysgonamonadaceae bacterium]
MNSELKIEFYKNREIGERLFAATNFLKQNWRILLKNNLMLSIPLAIVMGYTIQYVTSFSVLGDYEKYIPYLILHYILAIAGQIALFSMNGAIMIFYDKGKLKPGIGYSEWVKAMSPLALKSLLINLYIVGFAILVGLVCFIFASVSKFFIIPLVIILICGIVLIAPALLLIYYPAYFKNVEAWKSIQIAFRLGFKDWGRIFVAIIIFIILAMIVSFVMGMPYQIYQALRLLSHSPVGDINIFSCLFASFSTLGSLIITPVTFIYFAFQYFSIVEQEEGVSAHSMMDEFDRL